MTEYTVAIHNAFASLDGAFASLDETQVTQPNVQKKKAQQPQQQNQQNQQQHRGGQSTNAANINKTGNQGGRGAGAPSGNQGGRGAGGPQQGGRGQQASRSNQQDNRQKQQGGAPGQNTNAAGKGGSQSQNNSQQGGAAVPSKKKINYVPVVPNMTLEARRGGRFEDRDRDQGPREEYRGPNQMRDFRGDENRQRDRGEMREGGNYRGGERVFGRPRGDRQQGGGGRNFNNMDRHSRTGYGIKDNTKRQGGGARQWGMEGSEVMDIDERDLPAPRQQEPLVKEATPASPQVVPETSKDAGTSPAEGGEKKEGSTTAGGEEKKEGATAEGGAAESEKKKKKKKKKKKGDKDDKKGKGKGGDSDEVEDPNALKDEQMVLYEDFLKTKKTTLPKLPSARKGGEGVAKDPKWKEGVLFKRDEEEIQIGGKNKEKKPEVKDPSQKKDKKALAPAEQVPIVFEMRDTRRDTDRGFARGSPGGRRRDRGPNEGGNPPQGDRQGFGRQGGRGRGRFGGGRSRAPNFDERSFPALSPSQQQHQETQQHQQFQQPHQQQQVQSTNN